MTTICSVFWTGMPDILVVGWSAKQIPFRPLRPSLGPSSTGRKKEAWARSAHWLTRRNYWKLFSQTLAPKMSTTVIVSKLLRWCMVMYVGVQGGGARGDVFDDPAHLRQPVSLRGLVSLWQQHSSTPITRLKRSLISPALYWENNVSGERNGANWKLYAPRWMILPAHWLALCTWCHLTSTRRLDRLQEWHFQGWI